MVIAKRKNKTKKLINTINFKCDIFNLKTKKG